MRKRKDEWELAIETALALGAFIGYRDSERFVDNVEAVRANIVPLIEHGDAARAVALFETFIAGCYEKADEIDDSGGSFGFLVEELFCDWIRARQAAKADPAETARMLLSWMQNDNYGYCGRLETKAVKVLDGATLEAFETAARDHARNTGEESGVHRRKIRILKAIYETRRDAAAYAALIDSENDVAPADCEALAKMLIERRRNEEALAWVERGLDIEKFGRPTNRPARDLPNLKRDILKKLGRSGDAVASAWEDYRRAPSVYTYENLMRSVPKADRPVWHAKALGALDEAGLSCRIDLLIRTKERERLAAIVGAASREQLTALSHYTVEPAAQCLAKSWPILAAKLHVAMAIRILEAKKSKYYDAALANLDLARTLMRKVGHDEAWTALEGEIRERHRRKLSFISAFDRLAEVRREMKPSFGDRARLRWSLGAAKQREES